MEQLAKQLKQQSLFVTPLWQIDLIDTMDVDLFSIKKQIGVLKKLDEEGAAHTNRGGWQSKAVQDILPYDSFTQLFQMIQGAVNAAEQIMELGTKLKLLNYWFNVNEYGDYNTVHNHMGSIISGVFYIDIPKENDENCGAIEFIRNDSIPYHLPLKGIPKYTPITGSSITVAPAAGRLLLFPSWVNHTVGSNRSQETRISMSFNYGL